MGCNGFHYFLCVRVKNCCTISCFCYILCESNWYCFFGAVRRRSLSTLAHASKDVARAALLARTQHAPRSSRNAVFGPFFFFSSFFYCYCFYLQASSCCCYCCFFLCCGDCCVHICTRVSVAAVHLQVGLKETGGGRGLSGGGGGGGGRRRRREGQGGGEGAGRFEVVIVGTSEVVARCGVEEEERSRKTRRNLV